MVLGRRIWQIGTGDNARPYDRYFVTHDVALLGSGSPGKWSADNPAYSDERHIRAFASKPKAGDFIVARRGRKCAVALGVLDGEYDWSEAFDDCEGWDLQHYWRVHWIWVDEKQFERIVFPWVRFSASHDDEVAVWATALLQDKRIDPPWDAELKQLPEAEKKLDTSRLEPPLQTIIERAQAWDDHTWSGDFGDINPTEDELLTHITVPLLEALGWEPKQIAVKWRNCDLALFTENLREPSNCRLVVEGKRIGDGLHWAADQANDYVRKLGLQSADILVTNGLHYRLYQHPQYSDAGALWANLVRPKAGAELLFDALRNS